jgi:hypothetical protein
MRIAARSTLTASLVGIMAFTSAACLPSEFEGETFKTIEHTAVKQMRSLDSVHMSGSMRSDGQSMDLDLTVDSKGNCTGKISMGDGSAQFMTSGKTSYVKGDRRFWTDSAGSPQAADQVLTLLGSRWAKLPPSSPGFGHLCDLDKLMKDFTKEDSKAKGKKGESTDVQGARAVELVYKKGKETTVVWVATDAPHNVLKMEQTGGDDPGRFTFSEFNENVDIDAPTGKDVVDFSKL